VNSTTPSDFQRLNFGRVIVIFQCRRRVGVQVSACLCFDTPRRELQFWRSLKFDGLFAGFPDPVPTMFSLQTLFGKGDRFYQLLEDAAREAHESVGLVI
jgi:hypothetical protein